MANINSMLETVLRECQAKAPAPFFPSVDGKEKGHDRAALDDALDQLRLGGLVELTPWEAGRGQGYRLTAEGEQVLQSPRMLGRLRSHGVEARPAQPALTPAAPQPGEMTTPWERGEAVRAILMGGVMPVVTMTLIMANVFVFFMGMSISVANGVPANTYLEGQDDRVLNLLGSVNRTDVIMEGDWWRLLGYQFVHRGLLHLLLNMLSLYNIGRVLETVWRHGRFALLYLVAGVGGGTAVLLTHSGAVGASGSICGIFASLILFIMWNRAHLPPQVVTAMLRQLFLNAIIIVIISSLPGVSGAGHLGGAVAGAVVSIPLMYTLFGTGLQRWLGWLGVLAVPLVCVAMIVSSKTDQDQAMQVHDIVKWATEPAIRAYNDYARLINQPKAADARFKTEAVIALADAEDKVREAAARLEAFSAFAERSTQASFVAVKNYMKDWTTLLQGCLQRLQNEDRSVDTTVKLNRQARDLMDLRDRLQKSTDLVY